MHAPQVVHAHSDSTFSANSSSGRGLGEPSRKLGRSSKTPPISELSSMRLLISYAAGLSALPVAVAGQAS